MGRVDRSDLLEVGTALRGLQRSTFVALIVSGFRYGGQPTWLTIGLALSWLVVLWHGAVLLRSVPAGRVRPPAVVTVVGLAVLAVVVTVDNVHRSTDGLGSSQWAPVVGVLLVVPWMWFVRRLSQLSGDDELVAVSERLVRRTRAVLAFDAGAVLVALALEFGTGVSGGGPVAIAVVFTFVWQFRLWAFTRQVWQTLGTHPSSLTDDETTTPTLRRS